MRVSERMRLEGSMTSQASLSSRLDNASRIASSGQRVMAPSDDPVAYEAGVRIDQSISLIDKRSEIATSVAGELDVAEGAISTGVDLLSEARAAAVSGANDTLDANARSFLAQQVTSLRDEMIGIGNTRYGNKYIFGGTKTDVAPFAQDGTFSGNDVQTHVPVMPGVSPASNVSGAQTFTSAGGRDVLADLQTLATALANNDVATVRASIDNIDASHTQLVRGETDAGLSSARFRAAIDNMASTKTLLADDRSKQVEGDPIAQLTELTAAKTAYERGVDVTKQLLSVPSLATI